MPDYPHHRMKKSIDDGLLSPLLVGGRPRVAFVSMVARLLRGEEEMKMAVAYWTAMLAEDLIAIILTISLLVDAVAALFLLHSVCCC